MGFSGRYALTEIGYRTWLYVPDPEKPLTYLAADGRTFVLRESFETDGASVPRMFWVVPGLDPMDWPKGALLHDWLWECRKSGTLAAGFGESNELLAESLRSLGWSRGLAWVVKWSINLFGWLPWIRGERGKA
jgi:hypothetical protein